jgi:hypothetical protein
MRCVAISMLSASASSLLRVFSYDTALSYTLSAFVRAGNIKGAVKLCCGAHQP